MIIAFDFDGVIAHHESQIVMDKLGLDAFNNHERMNRKKMLKKGPMWTLAKALMSTADENKHRLMLITARGDEAMDRVYHCLHKWDLHFHIIINLDGKLKGPTLKKYKVKLFFDDADKHIVSAREHGVLSFKVDN